MQPEIRSQNQNNNNLIYISALREKSLGAFFISFYKIGNFFILCAYKLTKGEKRIKYGLIKKVGEQIWQR
ncbi:hypothetical protein L323_08610 [Ruminiclostridium papyrosolvens C7]|uniref:Uncharacterized protein n=1 Tax=Ruminiclostridium papyrosolvens C7 TaxID=1330534 RepID=U4R259_9FIRM|nr:hypothetical protein L323_08610 [Ruminiclostridium papyrosolvens C7]